MSSTPVEIWNDTYAAEEVEMQTDDNPIDVYAKFSEDQGAKHDNETTYDRKAALQTHLEMNTHLRCQFPKFDMHTSESNVP